MLCITLIQMTAVNILLLSLAFIWRNMNRKKKRRDSPLTKLLINQEYQLQTKKRVQLYFSSAKIVTHPIHDFTLTTPRNGYVTNYFMQELNTLHLPWIRRGSREGTLSEGHLSVHTRIFERFITCFYTFTDYSKTSVSIIR